MRVTIATRVFAPEPAAASFRLAALASALVDEGHEVTVLTSRFDEPAGAEGRAPALDPRVDVRRARVLRDRSGVVRGYLPYASFDVPLLFRLLARPRPSVIVVEPPPTTGLVGMAVAALRRVPFIYYAADVLADAAASAGSPAAVVRVVRWMERAVWRRASSVLSVSASVTQRLVELGVPRDRIVEVGNGIDLSVFRPDGPAVDQEPPYALYAGTASEVHGAGVFVEALAFLPTLRLVFLGGGTEVDQLRRRAEEVAPGRVQFHPTVPPSEAARWLRGAAVALGSVRPDGAYRFAFPTKLYAAAAAGAPLLFSGAGPGVDFVGSAPIGRAVSHDPEMVAGALREILALEVDSEDRRRQAAWARERVDLAAVAHRAAETVARAAAR